MSSTDLQLITVDGQPMWRDPTDGRTVPVVSGGDGPVDAPPEPEDETFEIPADLTTLSDSDLDSLTERTATAVDLLGQNETPTATDLESLTDLANGLEALRSERSRRDAEADELRANFRATLDRVREPSAANDGPDDDPDDDGDNVSDEEPPAEPVESVQASGHRSLVVTMPKRGTLNPTLADIENQRRGDGYDPGLDVRPDVVITAAADVPRLAPGQPIPTMDQLVEAAIARCKALGVTQGAPAFTPLATINREFPLVIDERMHPDAIRQSFEDMVADMGGGGREGMEALVAAGGWCAPSEIRYEFFQISEIAGMWDVPTFGVQRGGLRWPQSLSLSDFFALSGAPASGLATNATMPWEWTEADDISATGGSPSKVCLRPPCPDFDEARLRAFGICVLAGNLTQDAFPELVRHFISQVVVAHARVINRRMLLLAAAASTATTPAGTATESPTTHILGGYALNATDYRHKHGMADNAVLEGVLPSWVRELMRSDLAKRNGLSTAEGLNVADQMVSDFFDTRNIRMQWVQDWQTRLGTGIAANSGAIPTNWPTSVEGLLYAPGTFGRGNGLMLDLGVVRDSVLNEQNDHTAAWSEEATLLAKFGHESRVITFDDLVANGHSGQQTAMTGP